MNGEMLKTSDFYFDLPPELIAQDPLTDRSASRLLVLDKNTGEIKHEQFRNIINYLNPGDCLVLNDTRVIPARLHGIREETGDVLFIAAKIAQLSGVDPEDALHRACDKFDRRFRLVEACADKPLHEYSEEELVALWEAAKQSS